MPIYRADLCSAHVAMLATYETYREKQWCCVTSDAELSKDGWNLYGAGVVLMSKDRWRAGELSSLRGADGGQRLVIAI